MLHNLARRDAAAPTTSSATVSTPVTALIHSATHPSTRLRAFGTFFLLLDCDLQRPFCTKVVDEDTSASAVVVGQRGNHGFSSRLHTLEFNEGASTIAHKLDFFDRATVLYENSAQPLVRERLNEALDKQTENFS